MINIAGFCIFCFIFVLSSLYPYTVKGDVTGVPCSWGSWLPWNCSCCGNSYVITVYRARAKCCGGTAECGSLRYAARMILGGDKHVEDGSCMARCPKEYKGYNRHTCTSKVINLNGIAQSDKTQSCINTCIETSATILSEENNWTTSKRFFKFFSNELKLPAGSKTTAVTTAFTTTSTHSSLTTDVSPTKDTSSLLTRLSTSSSRITPMHSLQTRSFAPSSSEALSTKSSVLPPVEGQVPIGVILAAVFGCLAGLAILVFTISILLKNKSCILLKNMSCGAAEDTEIPQRKDCEDNANEKYATDRHHTPNSENVKGACEIEAPE